MRADVFVRDVNDHRRGLIAWMLGGVALALMYLLFYPTIKSSGAGIQQLLDSMPPAFRDAFLGAGVDYTSPNGYLGAELFSFLAPALMLVMGILAGTRALASEEANGTVDLLLATPVTRTRVVLEKAVAAMLPLFGVAAVLWVAVATIGPSQGLTVNLGSLAVALVAVTLLGVGFGMVGFAVASGTGSSALGGGIAAGLAVLLYLINLFGSLVAGLTGFAHAVSPFHWDGGAGVLADGVEPLNLVLLIVCPVVLTVVSVVVYNRRDLSA